MKTLLLCSAAALAVSSGARAADAVVAAEPEPMEYVRVCEAYGTGFFYIPGTETCLKISGTLRYEKRIFKTGKKDEMYDNHGRVRFDVEAKNDSEWGTVYSWMRLQADNVNNDSVYNQTMYYYAGIGGLEFGNWDSQWEKFYGYGGYTDDGGIYYPNSTFPDTRQYISYTADFGAWKAYVSLDNDADEFWQKSEVNGISYRGESHDDTDLGDLNPGSQYMPDLEAGASVAVGAWTFAGGAAYDESAESIALKGLVTREFGMFGVRVMPLWSESAQNIFFNYDGFSLLVGLQAKVTDDVTIWKDIQWWDDGSWRFVGDVNWQVADGFSILVEGIYDAPNKGAHSQTGMLRFQRAF
jgi:hypothetical protein